MFSALALRRLLGKLVKFLKTWNGRKPAIDFLCLMAAFYLFYLVLLAFFGPSGARARNYLSIYGALYVEPTRPVSPHVWLLIGAPKTTSGFWFGCFSRSRDGRVMTVHAPMIQLHQGVQQCKWTIYRVKCPVVDEMVEFAISNAKHDPELIGSRIPYRAVETTRRQVVVCQSRLYMYDKWQLLFSIIELYRFYGADMIAVYVDSVIADLYEFLKVYKERGVIAIKSAARFENFEDLDYDPNNETESHQLLSTYNLCLYEYRESTDFIIFGDWDEVLIPRNATNYFDDLSSILAEFDTAAAFRVQRQLVQSFIPKQSSFYDMADFLNTTHATDTYMGTKLIGVADKVQSVGIDRVLWAVYGTEEIVLTTEHSLFLHFRMEGKRTCNEEEIQELYPMLNTTDLAENFTSFIDHENLYAKYQQLPYKPVYSDAFTECEANLRKAREEDPEMKAVCSNQMACPMPEIENPISCVKQEIQYNRFILSDAIVVSYPQRISFVTNYEGCQ